MNTFDVGIVGTGTMGCAAAYHLSRRGARVVAFEQFSIVHELGSHSGSTRILRYAYHESLDYVPLVQRSEVLWKELEKESGAALFVRTGGIEIGPVSGTLANNAMLACSSHAMPYEHLQADEIRKRWPQFRIPEDWHGCYDPNMGFLLVESCLHSFAGQASNHGAIIRCDEKVLSFSENGSSVRVRTNQDVYEVKKVIFCAGSWTSQILRDLGLPLSVKRRPIAWFRIANADEFRPGRFPIFLAEKPEGLLYGIPVHGHAGIKIANHNADNAEQNPDTVDRTLRSQDTLHLKEFICTHLPSVIPEVIEGKVCLYTMTPDEDFIVDFHPRNRNILLAAGFSGRGFKFAPVIGEILADLCLDGMSRHSIHKFRIGRWDKRL